MTFLKRASQWRTLVAYLIVVTLLAPSFGSVNFAKAEELGNVSAELSLEESAAYSEEMQEEEEELRQAEEELREKERNIEPDQYETDDFCHQAGELLVNTPQPQHSLHTPEDVDWVKLRVEGVSELDFLLETYDPASAGGSKFSLYRECENGPQVPVLLAASDAKIKNPFKADGSYYIKVESVQQVVVPDYTLLVSSHPKAANLQGIEELGLRTDNVRKFPKGQFLPEVLEPASLTLTPQQVEELRLPANRDPEAEDVRDEREQERLQLTVPRNPEREELEYYNKASTGWQTIMTENGEGSFPRGNNWRVYDDNSSSGRDYWDDVSCRGHWGSRSIWAADIGDMRDCQKYDNNMFSWMIYGPFDLSEASAAKLEFYYWIDTESGHDFFKWYASSDGRNFRGYRASGNSNGWQSQSLDLASYLGDSSVWVAFVFQSNGSVTKEGAYVDDITLQKSLTPTDDRYEENDSRTQAYNLSSYEGRWLSSINGQGIQADHDWYQIAVSPGEERVKIDCRFTHQEGDIDLKLYNAAGSQLASSTGTRDNELIDYTVPGSGTYYLKVYYGNKGNQYDLKWDDLPAAKPDLTISNLRLSKTTNLYFGESVTVSWTASNQGSARSGSTQQAVMWSTDRNITKSDRKLGTEYLGYMGVGENDPESTTVNIPQDVTTGQTYYLGVIADYENTEAEGAGESNNNQASPVAVTLDEYQPLPENKGAEYRQGLVDALYEEAIYGLAVAGGIGVGKIMWRASQKITVIFPGKLLKKGLVRVIPGIGYAVAGWAAYSVAGELVELMRACKGATGEPPRDYYCGKRDALIALTAIGFYSGSKAADKVTDQLWVKSAAREKKFKLFEWANKADAHNNLVKAFEEVPAYGKKTDLATNLKELGETKFKALVADPQLLKKFAKSAAYAGFIKIAKDVKVLKHILKGEVENGKAMGWHHYPSRGPKTEIISGTKVQGQNGVYKAKVKINGVEKTTNQGYSTFFPDNWSEEEVLAAINEAYRKIIKNKEAAKRIGGASNEYSFFVNDVEIGMYLRDNKITSSFPYLQ